MSSEIFFFLIFAQNIDCGYTLEPPRRGGSNEYPQSMFWSKNKKNRYTPAYPSFANIKVGFKGVYITRTCFHDEKILPLSAYAEISSGFKENCWGVSTLQINIGATSWKNQQCGFRTGLTQTALYSYRSMLEA